METYIATLYAKKGHEDEVAAFYSGLTRDVEGLEERTVFRASDGRFAALPPIWGLVGTEGPVAEGWPFDQVWGKDVGEIMASSLRRAA